MLNGRKEMGGVNQRGGSGPVGGMAAKPEPGTRAGDPGADCPGQRRGREYPCVGGTAQGDRANGVSVAAAICQSRVGGSAEPAARWASATNHGGEGTSGSQRDPAQAEDHDPLECATFGQRSGLVLGHGASHLAEVRPAASPGRHLQIQPGPGVRQQVGRYRGSVSRPARTGTGAVRG